MAQMVEKNIKYGSPVKDVLLHKEGAFEVGVQVSNKGVATTDGKKIIPAGTPVGGTVSALKTRNTVLEVTNTSSTGANAQGVLRYDVDVTSGSANATMIVVGVVDTSKCPTIDATVETALKHIVFVNGGRA